MQSNNKTSSSASAQLSSCSPVLPGPTLLAGSTTSEKSLKRRGPSDDEIDAVFKAVLGNKTKKAAVGRVSAHEAQRSTDMQMSEVLGAIREAPTRSGESGRMKKRKLD